MTEHAVFVELGGGNGTKGEEDLGPFYILLSSLYIYLGSGTADFRF
jgi:hypothetical protein